MPTALIQFVASFAAVFLKGFQHQNVIGGKYVAAFFFSYMMSAADVVVIYFVAKTGWDSVLPVGAGASLGIVSSMLLYRWLDTKVSRRATEETESTHRKDTTCPT